MKYSVYRQNLQGHPFCKGIYLWHLCPTWILQKVMCVNFPGLTKCPEAKRHSDGEPVNTFMSRLQREQYIKSVLYIVWHSTPVKEHFKTGIYQGFLEHTL